MRTPGATDRESSDRVAVDVDAVGGDNVGRAIVGRSAVMARLRGLIAQVAPTNATVLIVGESGTGKELIAHAIHDASPRCCGPFVAVNCGALSDSLLESELFGHERGAFTGALLQHKGLIESADRGTLFLDEVATLAPRSQVELLRVLDAKAFRRLGGQAVVHVDFRVVCATNERLEPLVEQGRFRDDLYYRLNVFAIEAPPLREHVEDIEELAILFLRSFGALANKTLLGFEPDALDVLRHHAWPGNVRELANAVERAVVVAQGEWIKPTDLQRVTTQAVGTPEASIVSRSLDDVSKDHVLSVLARTGWNVTRAAEILGIDRGTVYHRLKRYGLGRPRAGRATPEEDA
ncbi:MAG: sigma-54-dependent Fis family transcriptional regulator [Deltaproteobacteria bacterium]|nr:sigma-54-dependent Fis family transcriptional regulator [Deltaproteobacteria bacterium]